MFSCRLSAQDRVALDVRKALDAPRAPLYGSLRDFSRGRLARAQNTIIEAIETSSQGSLAESASQFLLALEILSLPNLNTERIETACKYLDDIDGASFIRQRELAAELYFWRGECARLKPEFSHALNQYEKALHTGYDGEVRYFALLRIAEISDRLSDSETSLATYGSLAAAPHNSFALESSLRRAALFYRIARPDSALAELDRSRSLLQAARSPSNKVSGVIASPLQEVLTGSRNPSVWYLPFDIPQTEHDDQLLVIAAPPRIALIEGSSLTDQSLYDSALAVFDRGLAYIRATADSIFLSGEKAYYRDGLEFEKAWTYYRKGDYKTSAGMFYALALRDTMRYAAAYEPVAAKRFNDEFYEEPDPIAQESRKNGNSKQRTFTEAFYYNDFPARSRYYAGVAYAKAGESKQALAILTELSQNKQIIYSERSSFYQGLVEFQQGRMYQAEVLLDPIGLRRNETGAYASLLLGDIYYRRSSFARAAEYLDFALAYLPAEDRSLRARAQLELGLSLIPLGSWTKASAALAEYLDHADEQSAGYDEALFWLARSYYRADSMAQAREAFERLLQRYPNSERRIDAQYGYAWTLLRDGEFRQAATAFADVLRLDSITRYAYDALSRQGDAYYALGDLDRALATYNKAVDRPTFNPYLESRAMYQLGVARLKADSARSAMNAFTYIITKLPASDMADRSYYNLALAAYALQLDDRARQAIAQLESNFSASPFAPRGALLAAEEYERSGNMVAALAGYRRILKTYPASDEFIPALFNAIDLLGANKKYSDAIALADTQLALAALAPAAYSPRLTIRKAELQLEAGASEQAIRTARSFIIAYPREPLVPAAHYTIGRALMARGSADSGIAAFRMIIDSFPASDASAFSFLQLARYESKRSPDKAERYYTRAFDLKYYSTDAAPIAMAEYAALLRSRLLPDSALKVYEEITNRYFIETSAGSNAQFEAAEILLEKNRVSDAVSRLDRIAIARKGERTGGEARLKIAAIYRRAGLAKKAIAEYDRARKEYTLTPDQKGRSMLGAAELLIASGNKRLATTTLRELLADRGVPRQYRAEAEQLMEKIAPKKTKRPARKGKR